MRAGSIKAMRDVRFYYGRTTVTNSATNRFRWLWLRLPKRRASVSISEETFMNEEAC